MAVQTASKMKTTGMSQPRAITSGHQKIMAFIYFKSLKSQWFSGQIKISYSLKWQILDRGKAYQPSGEKKLRPL